MDTQLYNKIIADHKELASLPQTLSEILRVVQDENSSATDVADIIKHDPALTTKILRVVNSPLYSQGREVTTISQAVMTVGMRAVSALALSTSIYDVCGKWETTVDRPRFWRHSLQVAIAAREIAEAIRYPSSEEAFITGLIHDIGLLVMEKSFPEKFQRVWQQAESGANIFEVEEQAWGSNHARIGRFLLEQWNLPEKICQAIGFFYNEFTPGNDDEDMQLPQILALADSISKFTITKGKPRMEAEGERWNIVCCNLNLDPEKLKEIEQSLAEKTLEESRFLEINIGSEQEMLIEANRLLYENYAAVEALLEENRRLSDQIAQEKLKQAALDTIKTITATFNHYINNAAATILGRAQLIEVGHQRGEIIDSKGTLENSISVINNGVNTITAFMGELKNLTEPKTIVYHDSTYILDLESKIQKQLAEIEKTAVS
ncbi:MAG: HDOD domain-containing protein [bacterium]|nr:HDOD domain-containing protein [bacterium]